MLNKLVIRTIKNGYCRYCNGQNYINNGYSVYLYGTTLVVREVCINDYGSIFDCQGYEYSLTFAPSEIECLQQGFIRYIKEDEL